MVTGSIFAAAAISITRQFSAGFVEVSCHVANRFTSVPLRIEYWSDKIGQSVP